MANEAANNTVKSGVMVKVLPEMIEVKQDDNGRYKDPDRRPLIIKILQAGRVNVALVVRKVEQNKLRLVAGYGRHAAATFINMHLTDGVLEKLLEEAGITGVTVPTVPIKVPIIAETMNPEEAFRRNISENDDRSPTTYVDKAFNIRTYIQNFNHTEEEARFLYPDPNGKPKSPAWVTQMLKITGLAKEILDDIVFGERSANVCFALADMPEEARGEVLAFAKQEAAENGTQVTATSVVQAARKLGKKTAKVGRKMRELNELLDDYDKPGVPYHAREFSKTMKAWIKDEGEDLDTQMKRAFFHRFKESPKDN